MNNYQVGRVYIWQNLVQSAHLNGQETTVTGPHQPFYDSLGGTVKSGWPTDTIERGVTIVAIEGQLRPKEPPRGEQSILELFKVPELA